ncbi:hypothetical protein [Halospeciosus flavus]|uniref:Uncharacterized protein n=1 Tax=Halospeciosus flavus TaxID=3032283 RepID=A0ABD5Z2Y6_9EURY|nr:hypothetical protein [Halospeciosus flavus]
MKYVVLFNVPEWQEGWGYSKNTLFDTRHDAAGAMARLARLNPDVDYKLDVFG